MGFLKTFIATTSIAVAGAAQAADTWSNPLLTVRSFTTTSESSVSCGATLSTCYGGWAAGGVGGQLMNFNFGVEFTSATLIDNAIFLSSQLSVQSESDLQIRFSYPVMRFDSLTAVDLDTGLAVPVTTSGGGTALPLRNHGIEGLVDLRTSAVKRLLITGSGSFQGGNYLTPSYDPNCAAFDCMRSFRDQITWSGVSWRVTEIPEPVTLALCLAGLSVVGVRLRRRG